LSLQPNAAVVCRSLRRAILEFGLPEVWQRDNGKEFVAKRLDGPARLKALAEPGEEDLAGRRRWPATAGQAEQDTAWEHLGVRVSTALPYHAWSKHVESLFSAWTRLGYEKELPGWCGRSAAERPEKLEKELRDGRLLTLERYAEILGEQVAEWNRTHRVGKRKKPPLAYYEDHERRIPSAESLAFLFQAQKRLRVNHYGLLIDRRQYQSEALMRYVGCKVDVRYDPAEPEWVYAYPGDGECLAVPYCPPAEYGAWGEANERAARARKAQRAYIRSIAVAVKGACPAEGMDPYGAHRVVEARSESGASGAREQRAALEAARDTADSDDEPSIYDESIRRLNARLERGERPNAYSLATAEAELAGEPRPDGNWPLRRLWWDLLAVRRAVREGRRREADLRAAECWARAALDSARGRSLLRKVGRLVLAALEEYAPQGPKLYEAARPASLRQGPAGAEGVARCLVEAYNLGATTLDRRGVEWRQAVAEVKSIAAQLAAGWEQDRFAGAVREDLEALDRIGLLGLAGLELETALEGAAGADRRGCVEEWDRRAG